MYFPGDRVDGEIENLLAGVTVKGKAVENVRLGPGILHEVSPDGSDRMYAASAGTLQYRQPNKFWLETASRKRYIPHPGDLVIGRVIVKTADYLKVDLGGAHPAILPLQTGFEASTRRNRPNLTVGSLVYGRISQADRYVEPEILCVDLDGKGNAFGELACVAEDSKEQLKGFMLFQTPVNQSWRLQRPDCPILQLLGKHLPFEIVMGANGRYAIDSPSIALTMLIHRWISAEQANESDVKEAKKKYIKE